MKNSIRIRAMRIICVAVLFVLVDFASYGAAHCFTATLNWKDDGGTPLAPAHDVPVPVRISTELIDGFNYAETANGTNFEIADAFLSFEAYLFILTKLTSWIFLTPACSHRYFSTSSLYQVSSIRPLAL